jgi:hypothetical protein
MGKSDNPINQSADRLLGPSALWLWCVPGCIAIAASILVGDHTLSLTAAGVLWTAATLWIGLGCAWNAYACGRVHCFVDGALLPLLAILGVLNVAGVIAISWNLYWGVFAVIVVAGFVPEVLGKTYLTEHRS